MRPIRASGIGLRIALVTLGVAASAIAILVVGVLVVGGQTFQELMVRHGEDAAAAHAMFDEAVTRVMAVAIIAAVATAAVLATFLGPRIARPLLELGSAARRIADGDYRARLASRGPDELASLIDAFNQMATSLEAQERTRGEFIANAAHELRTPLANLQGYLEALRDGVIPPDRSTFESLWEEADRLVRLSRSLDLLADGVRSPELGPGVDLDLAGAVRSAVELTMATAHAKDLDVSVDATGPLLVRADPDGIVQILANLLQNAVRYTPRAGRVVVHASETPEGMLVSVANTGDGIPPEDLPHVFDRFYRVEKSRDRALGGAGIGLAIVRQLVEDSGGRVGVESTAGLTRFWFRLPKR